MSRRHGLPFVTDIPERRILLQKVCWDTYRRLAEDLRDSPGIRLNFAGGYLEILHCEAWHEIVADAVADIVKLAAEAARMDCVNGRSVTLEIPERELAGQADGCFFFGDAARRAKTVSHLDPTALRPDLIVEVEPTGFHAETRPLYALLEVPEIWTYTRDVSMFVLKAGRYHPTATSYSFPWLTSECVARVARELSQGETPSWKVRDDFLAWASREATAAGPVSGVR